MLAQEDGSDQPLTNRGRQQIVPKREENERDMSDPVCEGKKLMGIFLAEFIGTGFLLLVGCMSQIIWSESDILHPWQGSVVFAVTVATVISIFGHITAAHLNPAVTLCFLILGHISYLEAIIYVVAEVAGAIAGFGMLKIVTPCDIFELSMQYSGNKVCVTYPHATVSNIQAFIAEFIATAVVVLVVCSCCDKRNNDKQDSVALKFGATILALCIAEGPYTGASMNPARSLGPVVWLKAWDKHWIYWLAPLSGSFIATIFYLKMFGFNPNMLDKEIEVRKHKSVRESELRSVSTH